jgi:parallel beta-helix repeat protein
MKKLAFIISFIILGIATMAQWATPYTTATCGGTATIGDSVTITYTIGQAITLSGYLSGDTTQASLIGGFQQPFYPVSWCGDVINETRTLGPGLVHICGDIDVKQNGVLNIRPQTTLQFSAGYGLYVENTGKIIAEGTEDNPIRFTSDTALPDNYWNGVRFDNMTVASQQSLFKHCIISNADVSAAGLNGGGMMINNFHKVTLENCRFENCHAKNGGALAVIYSGGTVQVPLLSVTNCEFEQCSATENGGGLYFEGLPFEWNKFNFNNVSYNEALNGGGLAIKNCGALTQNACFFHNNTSSNYGGAMYVFQSDIYNLNSIIANNTADNGGGVYGFSNSTLSLYNNTIVNNLANTGPAISTLISVNTESYNTILWGNRNMDGDTTAVQLSGNDTLIITNSCFELGEEIVSGNGAILDKEFQGNHYLFFDNPFFSKPTISVGTGIFTEKTDWQLDCFSSCINNGYIGTNDPETFSIDTLDILMKERISGTSVDIGAIEGQSMVFYEDVTWSGEIEVCQNIEIRGGTLTLEPGTDLKFIGENYIKATQNGCIKAIGNEYDSIYLHPASVETNWQGIILENISAEADSSIFKYCLIEGVKYLYQTQNAAPVQIINSQNTLLSNNTISNNTMANRSAGIYIENSSATIQGNYLLQNTSSSGTEGTIYAVECDGLNIINNYLISNNSAHGGGVMIENCTDFNLTGNLITNNKATFYGSVKLSNSNGAIVNNTIAFNLASQYGGIYSDANSTIDLFANNILWGNISNSNNYEIYYLNEVPLSVTASCIENGYVDLYGVEDNLPLIETNPDFVNPSSTSGLINDTAIINSLDWHVFKLSPCFNSGSMESEITDLLPENDYIGETRISYEVVDVGALETRETCPAALITEAVTWGPKLEYICNNVTVTDGGSVNILPGTTLEFIGDYEVVFEGNAVLKAEGTENDSIIFTGQNADIDWKGFRFESIAPEADTSAFSYCKFLGVNDTLQIGGAVVLENVPFFNIHNSLFEACETNGNGGAVYSINSSVSIISTAFINCSSDEKGGAIYTDGNISITNAGFTGNDSNSGAAVYVDVASNKTSETGCVIEDSRFMGNFTYTFGPVLLSKQSIELNGCLFANNFSDGSVMNLSNGTFKIINNLIANNETNTGMGSVIFCPYVEEFTDSLFLVNNTIVNNLDSTYGPTTAIYAAKYSFFTNNIFWNNNAWNNEGFEIFNTNLLHFSNNCITDGENSILTYDTVKYYPDPTTNFDFPFVTWNNNYDPQFVNPSAYAGLADNWNDLDYSLNENSDLINKGYNDPFNCTLPEYDLAGNDRIQNNLVDIGCYETPLPAGCLSGVLDYALTIGPGTINLCGDLNIIVGGELTIEPNTTIIADYYHTIRVDGGSIKAEGEATNPGNYEFLYNIHFTIADEDTVTFDNSHILSGGWKGIEIISCTDSCIFNGCKISFTKHVSGYSETNAAIVTHDSKVRIGYCKTERNYTGIRIEKSAPKIYWTYNDKNITGVELIESDIEFGPRNKVRYSTNKGLYVYYGEPIIKDNNYFRGNQISIETYLSDALIIDNSFHGYMGQGQELDLVGIKCWNGNVVIEDNTIIMFQKGIEICSSPDALEKGSVKINRSHFQGDQCVIHCDPEIAFSPDLHITNNYFEHSIDTCINISCDAEILNNTMLETENLAMRVFDNELLPGPMVTFYSNIIYYDETDIKIEVQGEDALINIGYSCIEGGGNAIEGNVNYIGGNFNQTCIDANPLVSIVQGNLQETSPCINTGYFPNDISVIGQEDQLNRWRIKGGRVDMGCWEYGLENTLVADFTGSPRKSIVPFEVQFTDLSIAEPTAWEWDFDGSGLGSTQQNPTFVYNESGSYPVTLSVYDNQGTNEVSSKENYIIAYQIPDYFDDFEGYSAGQTLADIVYWYVIDAYNAPVIAYNSGLQTQVANFEDKQALIKLADKTEGVYEISFNWSQETDTPLSAKFNIDAAKQNEEISIQSQPVGDEYQVTLNIMDSDIDIASTNHYNYYSLRFDLNNGQIEFRLNGILEFSYNSDEHEGAFISGLVNLHIEGGGFLDNFSYFIFDNTKPKLNTVSLVDCGIAWVNWSPPTEGQPDGYNIYRDGDKMNAESVTDTIWLDESIPAAGNYSYFVKAVYGADESNPSNTETLTVQNQNVFFDLESGWQGISFYHYPIPAGLETIFSDYEAFMEIIMSADGFFWPGQNINTIGDWECASGYALKMNTAVPFAVNGWKRHDFSLTLDEGWNICPVLSDNNVNVETLFADKDVIIAKDVAGYGVYWPDYNINTLGTFISNSAYHVKANSAFDIEFPQSDGKSGKGNGFTYQPEFPENMPWEIAPSTSIDHTIAILQEVINHQEVKPGGVVAALDENGQCFGATVLSPGNTSISIFGDDPTTAVKDGFAEGEIIRFNYFDPESGKTIELTASFAPGLPNADGLYHGNGLSAIKSLQTGSAGVAGYASVQFEVFPNPADELLYITKHFEGHCEIIIYSVQGTPVIKTAFDEQKTELNVKALPAGVYFVELKGTSTTGVKRLVIK